MFEFGFGRRGASNLLFRSSVVCFLLVNESCDRSELCVVVVASLAGVD